MANELPAGTKIDGRYRLEATIAHGGMSTVYLATDERLERHVAIKLLSPHLANDSSFIDRLKLEAKSVARLSHPGVVQVFDQGVDAEGAFLVMELVPGGTLREVVNERGPMPAHVVLSVLRPILGALDDAHSNGLIHRDIKPENIMVSQTGAVKLGDFGLVRAVAEARSTSQNIVLGTAAYLAPEQIATGDTDPRSDLYSLGVVAFELLTGRVPFQGDNPVATAYQRLERNAPPPSSIMPGIPEDLDDLILHATERDPCARISSAREFLRRVEAVAARNGLHNVIVPAPTISAWSKARERAARDAQRNAGSNAKTGETVFDIASRESAKISPAQPDAEKAEWGYGATSVLGGRAASRNGRVLGDTGAPASAGAPGSAAARAAAGSAAAAGAAAAAGVAAASGTPATPGVPAAAEAPAATRQMRRVDDRPPAVQPHAPMGPQPTAQYHGGQRLGHQHPQMPIPPGAPRGQQPQVAAPAPNPPVPQCPAAVPAALSKRRRGIGCLAIVVIAILALLLAFGGWWLGSGRLVAIPQTSGMTVEQATATLNAAGLYSTQDDAYDNDVPPSITIGTDPESGDRVAPGSTVTLRVSAGAPVVPELNDNRSRAYVEQRLADRTFVAVAGEEEYSDDVAEGDVISLDPAPGTQLRVGDTVTMRLSNGPAPVDVPDVADLSEADARTVLERAGLRVGEVHREFNANVAAGMVSTTSPAAGAQVARTSQVDLVISTAAEVPDVSRMSVDDAVRTLEDAGFAVATDPAETDSSILAGNVIRTEPAAGERADTENTTVRIVPSDAIRVPVVLGDSVSRATEKLRDAGLNVRVDSGRSGVVYGQSPLPGRIVGPGTTVEIDALG